MKRLLLCSLLMLTLAGCSQSSTSEPPKVQEKATVSQAEVQKDTQKTEPAASTTTTASASSGDAASAPAAQGQQQPASTSGTTSASPESSTSK